MAEHTARTLVYARTPGGVVSVSAGQGVPEDVLPGELDRLLAVGAVEVTLGGPTPPPPGLEATGTPSGQAGEQPPSGEKPKNRKRASG